MIVLIAGILLIIPMVAAETDSRALDASFMTPLNPQEWSTWESLGQAQTAGTPFLRNASPGMAAKIPNYLDVVVFDTSSNASQLKQKWWQGSNWSPIGSWWDAGDTLPGGRNPVGLVYHQVGGALEAYANGNQTGKCELYEKTKYTNNTWRPWVEPWGYHFEINCNSGISAVAPSSTQEYIIWTGTDHKVKYVFFNGTGWEYMSTSSGIDIGAPSGLTILNTPAAVVNPDIALSQSDVMVFAQASDTKLWYNQHSRTSLTPLVYCWTGWVEVPGSYHLAGAPSAVSRYPGCIDVVYRSTSGSIVLREYTDAGTWTGEVILNGSATNSDPTITSWDQARLDVVAQDSNGYIIHTYWNSPKPEIVSASPSSVTAGSSNTTITITGNNFYPNSEIRKDNPSKDLLVTTFIDEHTLTAVIPASWLAVPGSIPVYVNVPGTTQSNFYSTNYTISVTGTSTLTVDKIGIFNAGNWYVDYNGDGQFTPATGDKYIPYGATGWTQLVGDWNGDGKSEIGIYKDAVWYLDYGGSGVIDANTRNYQFGAAGWTPVTGDWNGDKKDETGVYQNGNWYLDYNGNGFWDTGDKNYGFGSTGWTPVVGKWTTDGISKIGVYRNGNWYVDYNGDGQFTPATGDKYIPYGATGWTQLVGDWNGDGKSEIGIYKDAVWYLDYGGSGVIDTNTRYYQFGAAGWTPVTGDWNGDKKDETGVYQNGNWYLDYNGNGFWDTGDKNYGFGSTGWTPVVGKWK